MPFFQKSAHSLKHGALGVVVSCVEQREAALGGFQELMMLDVGRHQGVAAGLKRLSHKISARAAHHGHPVHRPAAVDKADDAAAKALLDKPGKGLRRHALSAKADSAQRLLSQAASVKTRLAWIENAGEESVSAAEAAGFCPLDPDLDRAAYPLSSTGAADTLLQRVTSRGGEVTVWLGDSANAAGLGTFLSAAEAADDRCLAMTETVS